MRTLEFDQEKLRSLINNIESNNYRWCFQLINPNGAGKYTYLLKEIIELPKDWSAWIVISDGKERSQDSTITANYNANGLIKRIVVNANGDAQLQDIDGLIMNPLGEQLDLFS